MATEDPALRSYRTFLVVLLLVGGGIAAVVGGVLLWRGKVFYAFLALAVVGFLMLLIHGYRQEQADQDRAEPRDGAD